MRRAVAAPPRQRWLSPPSLLSLSSSASVSSYSFLSCTHPLPSSLLPRSPAQSRSIWEGLLGLASLQCREGQGGCFTTMRWRMVHQEKRVYQVCGYLFACVGDPEGVAYWGITFRGFSSWQISIMLMKQPWTDVWLLGGMCLFRCRVYRSISVFLRVCSTTWNDIIACLHMTFIVQIYSYRSESHITMAERAVQLVHAYDILCL